MEKTTGANTDGSRTRVQTVLIGSGVVPRTSPDSSKGVCRGRGGTGRLRSWTVTRSRYRCSSYTPPRSRLGGLGPQSQISDSFPSLSVLGSGRICVKSRSSRCGVPAPDLSKQSLSCLRRSFSFPVSLSEFVRSRI